MIRRSLLPPLLALALLAAGRLLADEPPETNEDPFLLRDGQTVVFLGDSITHAGGYIADLDAFLMTRLPNERFRLINRGMPSETVAGTSEPVHKPPRPDLATRFEKTIGPLDPDVIVACYGMNDGVYRSFDPEVFQKYQAGIQRLIDHVKWQTHARLVLMTPPPFDFEPHRGRQKPGTAASFMNPAEDYDKTLGQFSTWLRTLSPAKDMAAAAPRRGPVTVDLHGPINSFLAERRKSDPHFRLAADGIHLDATGHWLIAQQMLAALGAPDTVAEAIIDAKAMSVTHGEVTSLKKVGDGIEFHWTTGLPMPVSSHCDPAIVEASRVSSQHDNFNRYTLWVTDLPPGRYDLLADGHKFGVSSDSDFAGGLDMNRFAEFPTVRESAAVLPLVEQRQALLKKLWVKDETHPRLAADRARLQGADLKAEQVDELEKQIRKRCQPREVVVRIVPASLGPEAGKPAPPIGNKPGDKPSTSAGGPEAAISGASKGTVSIRPDTKTPGPAAAAKSWKPDKDWKRDSSPEMGLQGHRANQSSRRNTGSACTLTGPTLIYQVYISDRSSSWDDRRREEIRHRVDEALGFLVREGLKYQQRVQIAQKFGPPVTLTEDIPKDPQADAAWSDKAVRLSSGHSPLELVEQLRKSESVDNVILMLHLNKPGRSYNISYYRGVPKEYFAERLVLFTHFNRRDQTPPASYAHEILHVCGAGDLYYPFDQDDGRYLRAKRLFPNDVMFRIDDKIDRLEVDEWTAYRVGWVKTLKPELNFLEDPR